ncbi:MAG: hypothetical protein KAG72_10220 [Abyssibacter sp.]|nr:hypothetical protein [Abyssibacter sp.]MCK5859709.1 hypothetical protein [Abyssibacter sp.]
MTESDQAKSKTVVHRDEVKERHTSHWDLDVLPDHELEALYAKPRNAALQRRLWKAVMLAASGLLAVTVAAGLAWWLI